MANAITNIVGSGANRQLYSAAELRGLPLGYDLYNVMLPALSSQWQGSQNSGLYANWMDPSVRATNEAGQDSAINSTPSQAALDSLNGYQFAWNPQGPENSGALVAYKDGAPVRTFSQADTGVGQALTEWAALAAAGFGGLALAGAGPLAGAAAGAGGGASTLTGPGSLDAYAAMDAAYGAAGAEGAAGAAGSSLTGAGALDSYAAMDAGYGAAGSGMTFPGESYIGSGFNSSGITNPNFGAGADFAKVSAANGGGGSLMADMGWGDWAKLAAQVGGSILQSNAVGNASDAQSSASASAIAEQRRQYDLTRSDFAPWREAGKNALTTLTGEINTPTTAADVMQDPGYAFGLQQGQQALDRKAAASGGRISGASLKAASGFASGQATAGYNAAYQRREDRLNRLAALANIGQTATGSSAAAGANMSNNVSSLIASQGDASAAARMAQGNIWGNTANSIASLYSRNNRPASAGGASPYYSTSDPSGNGYY